MATVLYISYDGVMEPLGQSQVVAYIEKLAADHRILLISFEKPNDRANLAGMRAMRDRLAAAHIRWTPLAYHKVPSAAATAYDIWVGVVVALYLARRHGVSILHARSYVAALIAQAVKRATGARFLFDMRGFWADERVDGGIWPANGLLYRATKSFEKKFLVSADHVVTLTHASKQELRRLHNVASLPEITVIPTCADLDQFRPLLNKSTGPFTVGYLGSIGTWYLFDETLALFKAIRTLRPEARLLVVNRNEHPRVKEAIARAGISNDNVELTAADFRDVPMLISRMDIAAALIKPSFSKIASAPTKLAEYLGCGVPCVGNTNVGDVQEILEGRRVGIALDGFSKEEMQRGAERILQLAGESNITDRCVQAAHELFSLGAGVAAYKAIYQRLEHCR